MGQSCGEAWLSRVNVIFDGVVVGVAAMWGVVCAAV